MEIERGTKASNLQSIVGYYKRPEISNSDLNKFEELGPSRWKHNRDSEDEKEVESQVKSRKVLAKGRAFHMALLEPEKYGEYFLPIDANTPKSSQQKSFVECMVVNMSLNFDETDAMIMAFKDNYKWDNLSHDKIIEKSKTLFETLQDYFSLIYHNSNAERIVLSKSENEHMLGAIETLKKDEKVIEILEDIKNGKRKAEHEIYWNHPNADVDLRSKLDVWHRDDDRMIISVDDFKTTKSATAKWFPYEIMKYKLHKQLAFYLDAAFYDALEENFGAIYELHHRIIGVELVPPYNYNIFRMADAMVEEGRKLYKNQLSSIDWHFKNGVWKEKEFHEKGFILVDAFNNKGKEESED